LKNSTINGNILVKFVKSSNSFDVAKSIAIRGKPFGNGDFIKMAWLDCADNLFNDFIIKI